MQYMDSNKTYGVKAWRQLHKNDASNIEQDLEATLHKTSVVQPPTTLSRKLFNLDELDMQDTVGEVGTNE